MVIELKLDARDDAKEGERKVWKGGRFQKVQILDLFDLI